MRSAEAGCECRDAAERYGRPFRAATAAATTRGRASEPGSEARERAGCGNAAAAAARSR